MAEKMCRICRTAPRHQTYKTLCLECARRAQRDRYRDLRSRNVVRDQRVATAANRARSRLAAIYADDYRRLMDEERVKLGLEPAARTPRNRVGPRC